MKRSFLAILLLIFSLTACSSLPFSLPGASSEEASAPMQPTAFEPSIGLGLSGQETPAVQPGAGLAPLPGSASATAEPTMVVTLPEVAAGPLTPSNVAGALFSPPVYGLQPGTPVGVANFLHPEAGCNWSGVAGQVFDKDGNALTGLIVQVTGSLEGKEVLSLALTGSTQAIGPGGYEVALSNRPVASHGVLWAQLYDIGGKPLTSRLTFDTYGSCEKALVMINFTEARNPSIYFFPNIFQNAPFRR